jgi:hypothetical protein
LYNRFIRWGLMGVFDRIRGLLAAEGLDFMKNNGAADRGSKPFQDKLPELTSVISYSALALWTMSASLLRTGSTPRIASDLIASKAGFAPGGAGLSLRQRKK